MHHPSSPAGRHLQQHKQQRHNQQRLLHAELGSTRSNLAALAEEVRSIGTLLATAQLQLDSDPPAPSPLLQPSSLRGGQGADSSSSSATADAAAAAAVAGVMDSVLCGEGEGRGESLWSPVLLSHLVGRPVARVIPLDVRELEQSDIYVLRLHFDGMHIGRDRGGGRVGSGPPPSLAALAAGETDGEEEVDVLVKAVSMAVLRRRVPKSDAKWAISWASFVNEATFLRHAPIAELRRRGVMIPALLHCTVRGGGEDAAPSPPPPASHHADTRGVLTVMQFLPPTEWEQLPTITTLADATAALRCLARWHAFFWRGRGRGREGQVSGNIGDWQSALFRPGGWWRKPLRPSVRYDTLVASFSHVCVLTGAQWLDTPANRGVLGVLATRVDDLTAELAAPGPFCTVFHGDPTACNGFFRRGWGGGSGDDDGGSSAVPCDSSGGDNNDVALVDFQWSGTARSGAGDVAYFLLGSVDVRLLEQHEGRLLAAYHAAFAEAVDAAPITNECDSRSINFDPAGHSSSDYVLHEWQREYELEQLAYCSTAIPQLLGPSLTVETMAANVDAFGFLTHEQDARAAVWLCQRAVGLVGRLQHTLLPPRPRPV